MGLRAPNHTQTPNELFDEWLPKLGCAELKVLMVIIRKTFGWHKTYDKISLGQLEALTGLERRHISKAIKTLSEKRLISKKVIGTVGRQVTYYELVVEEVSNNFYQCPKDTPTSVLKTPTKETNTKEKKKEAASCFKRNDAAAPSIEDQIKKSRIPKEDQDAALKYFKANPDKFKKAKNPIGLLISIVDSGDHKKGNRVMDIIKLRRKWASENTFVLSNGYADCTKEGYHRVSGSNEKTYKWDSNDQFWHEHGLGFDQDLS